MEKGDLRKKWAVVREDWHYQKTYVPFPAGGYTADEDTAKARADELQAQTHGKDHHHKMNFWAEEYDSSGNDIAFG